MGQYLDIIFGLLSVINSVIICYGASTAKKQQDIVLPVSYTSNSKCIVATAQMSGSATGNDGTTGGVFKDNSNIHISCGSSNYYGYYITIGY